MFYRASEACQGLKWAERENEEEEIKDIYIYIFVVSRLNENSQRMNHSTAFDAIAPEVIKVKECVLGAGKLLLFRLLASFGYEQITN